MMANVNKEIRIGNKVIIDTRKLSKTDRETFKRTIHKEGLDEFVIWYDKKGRKQ